MRLRAINVYSAYLGDSEKTKKMTRRLREDSYFLYCDLYSVIKFVDNNLMKQLNIACDQNTDKISIQGSPDGYPQVFVPFDYQEYKALSDTKKKAFWVKQVLEIFEFLAPLMIYDAQKLDKYTTYLKETYLTK